MTVALAVSASILAMAATIYGAWGVRYAQRAQRGLAVGHAIVAGLLAGLAIAEAFHTLAPAARSGSALLTPGAAAWYPGMLVLPLMLIRLAEYLSTVKHDALDDELRQRAGGL